MELIITENQYKAVILEYFDRTKPYVREEVIKRLKHAPGYIKSYIKGLPRFYIRDENGQPYTDQAGTKVIFTTIPEIIYDFLHGRI